MNEGIERDALREYIKERVIESREAVEILGVSRMRLSQIVSEGKIEPICRGTFLKADIEAYKNDVMVK